MDLENGSVDEAHADHSQPSSDKMPALAVVQTIRLVMQGKEVGSIIGKKGDHIKTIRDESMAKINISDSSSAERIVTITGSLHRILKAFTMICRKFEEDQNPRTLPAPPITFRLIIPATQCGCLIGKGGSKIKVIREATGASVQVASEMMPNSTERAVTISGSSEAVIRCIRHICLILLESPPKGANVPYRPKPPLNQLALAATAVATAKPLQHKIFSPHIPYGTIAPEIGNFYPFGSVYQTLQPGVPFSGISGQLPSNLIAMPSYDSLLCLDEALRSQLNNAVPPVLNQLNSSTDPCRLNEVNHHATAPTTLQPPYISSVKSAAVGKTKRPESLSGTDSDATAMLNPGVMNVAYAPLGFQYPFGLVPVLSAAALPNYCSAGIPLLLSSQGNDVAWRPDMAPQLGLDQVLTKLPMTNERLNKRYSPY